MPGSKSITNGALVLAALASRWSDFELHGALRSEDTEVMMESLRRLGFSAHWRRDLSAPTFVFNGRIQLAEEADSALFAKTNDIAGR